MTSARTSDLSSLKEDARVDPMVDRRHARPYPLPPATSAMGPTQAHACIKKSSVRRNIRETRRPDARDVAKASSMIGDFEPGTMLLDPAGVEPCYGPSIALPHAENSEHITRSTRPVEHWGRIGVPIENPNGKREAAP